MRDFFAKTSKLLLTLLLMLSLVVTLSACGKSDDEINLDAAYDALVFGDLGAVDSDMDLFTAGMNGAVITWESSDEAVIDTDGTVTRPAVGEPNATVTLTATITIGEYSRTKVFTVTVIAEVPAEGYVDVEDLLTNASVGETVEITAIVQGVLDYGFMVFDDSAAIFIYGDGSGLNPGDEVTIKGEFMKYNGQPEIGNIDTITTVSTGNTLRTPVDSSIADIYLYDRDTTSNYLNNLLDYGRFIKITGTVTVVDGDVRLVGENDQYVTVYYKSNDEAIEVFEGLQITVPVVYYTYRTDKLENHVIYLGDGSDLEMALTDAEIVATLETYVATQIPVTVVEATTLTLPTTHPSIGGTISWASDNEAVINSTTGVVTPVAGERITVTLTATVSSNAESATVELEVVVGELVVTNIADVRAIPEGNTVKIQGVVTKVIGSEAYIQDATGALVLYGTDDNIVVGNELTVVGELDIYNGLFEVKNYDEITVVSTGNTVDPLVLNDLSELTIENQARLVSISGLYVIETPTIDTENHYSIYVADVNGNESIVRISKYGANKAALDTYLTGLVQGDLLDLTGVTVGWYYSGQFMPFDVSEITITTIANQTVEQKLDAAASMLGISTEIVGDITLPDTGFNGTTIVWASSDETVIGLDGTVATVSSDTDVTLTATISLDGTDLVIVIVVTVVAPEPQDVSDVLALNDDEEVVVQGVVTGIYRDGYFIYDGTGYIRIDSGYKSYPGDTIAIGDERIISGVLDTDYGVRELNSLIFDVFLTADNSIPEGTVITIDNLLLEDTSTTALYSNLLSISGTLVKVVGTYTDYYIEDESGDRVYIDYRSNSDALALIDFYAGLDATVVISLLDYHSSDANWEVIVSSVDDITVTATEAEIAALALASALGEVETEFASDGTVTLITSIDLIPGVSIAWTSSNDLAIDPTTGAVVVTAEVNETVTLTATVTYGLETAQGTVDVDLIGVIPLSTVAETLALTDGDVVKVQGVVTAIMDNNVMAIEDADGTAIIVDTFGSSIADYSALGLQVGDLVTIIGSRGFYKVNNVENVNSIVVESSGNAVTAPIVVTDLAAFRADTDMYKPGKRYTFNSVELTFGNTSDYYFYFYADGVENEMGLIPSYSTGDIDFTTLTSGVVVSMTVLFYSSQADYPAAGTWRFAVTQASDFSVDPI